VIDMYKNLAGVVPTEHDMEASCVSINGFIADFMVFTYPQ